MSDREGVPEAEPGSRQFEPTAEPQEKQDTPELGEEELAQREGVQAEPSGTLEQPQNPPLEDTPAVAGPGGPVDLGPPPD